MTNFINRLCFVCDSKSNFRWMLIIGLLIHQTGCGYPEVSPATYDLAKTLYSACNRKSLEHLDIVSDVLEAKVATQELPQTEAEWLRDIIADGRKGHWDAATREARVLMEDQVRR